jgi:hypothetical protein
MKPDPQMELGTELEFYDSQLQALRRDYIGRFVLVKGATVLGAYESPEEAYCVGVDRFGAGPFLIRRVSAREDATSDVCPALTLGVLDAHP